MSSTETALVQFVVRTPGGWHLAPLPAASPVEVTVDQVVEVLRASGARDNAMPTSIVDVEPLADDVVIEPTWMWVGRIDRGVVTIATGSDSLHLDERDLELLDHATIRLSVAALADRCRVDDAARRISRLQAGGRIFRLVDRDAPETQPSVESTPTVPTKPTGTGTISLLRDRARPAIDAVTPIAGLVGRALGRLATTRGRSDGPNSIGRAAGDEAPSPQSNDPSEFAPQDTRIPVYSAWHQDVGPPLALGMLTAAARRHRDGTLNTSFAIRPPESVDSFLEHLKANPGPAVLLCSNYVWSIVANLDLAREAKRINPELVVVHGGPSSPKFENDAARFINEHLESVDILVRGEGEGIVCDLLEAFQAEGVAVVASRLRAIGGLTFRDPEDGTVVRTADVERIAELDLLPSPYLTGEFDHIEAEDWRYTLSIETNRGCPYGCTFCDWGSATMSRIRKFDLDRVTAEVEWAAARGVHTITITDANFGIMSRDVEIARRIAQIRKRTGHPHSLSWTAAKNTTKHLVQIMDLLVGSGLTVSTSLSLQTTDPETLEVLRRTNISTDHYVKLAADYRRRGFPIQGDLMLGLPGQTFESYKRDLQFMLDHEVMVRSWPVQMLPNSPMNDPSYRAEHDIQLGEGNLVTSTATFSEADRRRMFRYRTADAIAERMGVIRHVLRFVQWDRGIAASDLIEHLLDLTIENPQRFPTLSWVFGYFDIFPTVAVGWAAFYDELRRLLVEDYAFDADDSALATVLDLQEALMPLPGRTFPVRVELRHDYVTYYRSATRSLYGSGHAALPDQPLSAYPPADFIVAGDPLALCTTGVLIEGDSRNEIIQGDFHIGGWVANELDSPLIRILPMVSGHGISGPTLAELTGDDGATIDDALPDNEMAHPTPITISLRAT